MAERRKEREAQSAALTAMECELRKSYAAEREANRKAYLERKNAMGGTDSVPSASGGSQFTATEFERTQQVASLPLETMTDATDEEEG